MSILNRAFLAFGQDTHPETNLLAKLFGSWYDPRARPTLTPTIVSFRFNLHQILEVDERAQTVSLLTSTYQEWRDPRLRWNASEYEGLESFSIFYSYLWTPDTTLYNTCDMYRQNVEDRGNAAVRWNGDEAGALVQLIYNTHHTVGCRMNMKYFPFDEQNCTFEFGSWTYDESQLDYRLDDGRVTLENYKQHEEWEMVNFNMTAFSVPYQCCKSPYKVMHAHLVIRRKPLHYVCNLVLPTIIINLVASFALFASPGDASNRHDKLQIGITTLLSYCILLLSVSDHIPKVSTSIPLINWFFFSVMLQNMIKMYVAIFLSYPRRRKYVRRLCRRVWDRVARWSRNKDVHAETIKKIKDNNADRDEEEDRWPELICLWISVCVLAAITTAMFAVAFSQ